MTQIPASQIPQSFVPNYNAVKIDVINPQVNAPSPGYTQPQLPAYAASPYAVPSASVYEVPQQSIYGNQQPNFSVPPTAQQMPSIPQPVIVNQAQPAANSAPAAPAKPVEVKTPEKAAPAPAPAQAAAPAQPVEVKAPEKAAPQVDLAAFLAKLASENFEEQANAMESIADLAQNSPQKATELLDVKVIDSLLKIMNKDSNSLTGPTPKQLEIREKIINKKPVTDAETAEANTITPKEQAERNKQYSMYTTAILQKLYAAEIKKVNNTVVPLTELPGAAGIVEQLKSNPNPMVRASAVDSLSYNQAPEYKQDLITLFSIALKDQDLNVQEAAKKGLEKLAQVDSVAAPAAAAPAAAPAKA